VTSVIIQTLLDNIVAARKSPSGWISFNAPCCEHRGHNGDKRRRGGIKLTGHGVVYNCFNCLYTTGYTVGGAYTLKFRRLLLWLGVSAAEVNALKIQALRERGITGDILESDLKPKFDIVPRDLPEHCQLLDAQTHARAWQYLINRHLDPNKYTYFVSDSLPDRIIIPYTFQNQLVGYSARTIVNRSPKYIQNLGMPYVFGEVFQKSQYTWTPVVEGELDALSINGMAVLGNSINEIQAEQLDSLGTQLVIVPDQDTAGTELIQAAIDYGWSVSFPQWPDPVKDVNDAVKRWGSLFVLRHIWQTRVAGSTAIKLRRKLQLNRGN
jgi:Toprim-like